jgi:hypothetical protein
MAPHNVTPTTRQESHVGGDGDGGSPLPRGGDGGDGGSASDGSDEPRVVPAVSMVAVASAAGLIASLVVSFVLNPTLDDGREIEMKK